MLNSNYIENPQMLGENRLPQRSPLIPAAVRGITHRNFTDSDRVQLLNGLWKFRHLPEDTEEAFYAPDCPDDGWDELPVPSMWQYHGYGTCLYPNVQFPFPFDPPYIGRDNPVGLYRTRFTAKKRSGRAYLRFMGVQSAYFVFLNGEYVGFSKGSRLMAEFDVTDILTSGENLLCVKVYTWSDALYLESQDMLLANGIFRDVMLVYTGEASLWDYTLVPQADGLRVVADRIGDCELSLTLYDAGGTQVSDAVIASDADECFLPVAEPILWNAEQPYLYELVIAVKCGGEAVELHTKKVGFRESCVDGRYLKVNGKPILLKGVNRHDNNPWSGQAITAEQIIAELHDIKACGLNAIRCSHYTNQPIFYEIASELGLYVMDEADAESHGCTETGDQGMLNKDPLWQNAFFDRISRMYKQDKNETCIIIWALGNECGDGTGYNHSAKWLRAQLCHKPLKFGYTDADTDFVTIGYMSMEQLASHKEEKKPVMMIEYAHAMGNSPGGLADIWDYVYTHDHICGGYVWEYKNHGFYTEGRDGKPRYLYGGDFGDVYHWANFTLDGYHTSDGTPKPTWDELREISAPVRIVMENGGVRVCSTYDFKPLDGVVMRWSVCCDGKTVRGGEIPLDGIEARSEAFFPLELSTLGLDGLCVLDCLFYDGERELAHKQVKLADCKKKTYAAAPYAHSITEIRDGIEIRADDFTLKITNGVPSCLTHGGHTIFDAPMKLNLWRAPTDNDGIEGLSPRRLGEWRGKLVQTAGFVCHKLEVSDRPECVMVTAIGRVLPQGYYWGFETTLTYRILADGITSIAVSMHPYGKLPPVLPRVGVIFRLPRGMERAAWFGRGPVDSYPDRKANAHIGLYEKKIGELNFLYDVPQETGSHEDTSFVTISGDAGSITALGAFAFSCHDFTLENLTSARHFDELIKTEETYLYIDYRQRGIGSKSCGPDPEAQYELPPAVFSFDFTIAPDCTDAMKLTHYNFR